MKEIIEDFFNIYLSCIDSYNSYVKQTINNKYTLIDKAMLTAYLYIKILEDRKEKNKQSCNVLKNYLLRQTIYSETGNIVFDIPNPSKTELYNKILDDLVIKKFEYKNRIMKKLKYSYEIIKPNKYTKLITFLDYVSDYSIFHKLVLSGNQEAIPALNDMQKKIISTIISTRDTFYKEKQDIINSIKNNNFFDSQYWKLQLVALNLKDVIRYSQTTSQFKENVLFHQFVVTILGILLADFCNENLEDQFDLYTIIVKSLFHDFNEYTGVEILSHFKYYNDDSQRMFTEISKNNTKNLENRIGSNLFLIISNYSDGIEGYLSNLIDKMLGMGKVWIEVGYFNNNTYIKTLNAMYQERFKKFLKINKIETAHNKDFYLNLLREYYIYVKEHVFEKDWNYSKNYFTKTELQEMKDEIELLKNNPNAFLQS